MFEHFPKGGSQSLTKFAGKKGFCREYSEQTTAGAFRISLVSRDIFSKLSN